jgi:hypothetical protein
LDRKIWIKTFLSDFEFTERDLKLLICCRWPLGVALYTIAAKLEKYLKEIPSIQCIIGLENELEEAKKMIELLENSERELTKERDDVIHKAIRLEADVIELDAELNTLKSRYLYERRKHQTG